jgi:phosphoribosylformylglycinamidine cyclo-ligase
MPMSKLLDQPSGGMTYAEAGVSIDAGDEFVERIKKTVASTKRPEVLGGIGGFGGLFKLDTTKYQHPVLVSSADGVGTKLEVARQMGRYDSVGIDLVAMLVDDLACLGAEPLFLLDYVAVGEVNPLLLADLVAGIAEGCRLANTALLGGETAEHGGVMKPDDLDVAGFTVGVLEQGSELGPERVEVGDVLIGFHSPGLRSNGYSLARRVLIQSDADLHAPAWPGAARSLGDELLVPSVIYVPTVLALTKQFGSSIHACAHITGGGIVGNVVRVLPDHVDAVVRMDSFETPEIFFEIQRRGQVSSEEMVRVFNCGLGMVLSVAKADAEAICAAANENGITATIVGNIVSGAGKVQIQ